MERRVQGRLPILRKIIAFLKPHAPGYAAGIIGIGFANFFMNVFLARMLMDLTKGIMELSRQNLALTIQIMVGGTLLMVICVFGSGRLLVFSIHRTVNDIRRALFGKYLEMPLGEIEQRHSGDLLSRSTTALRQVTSLLMVDAQMFMSMAFSGIGSAVYMVRLDPRMGIAGILCSAVPLLVSLPFANPLRDASTNYQETQAAFTQSMSDLINGRDTIRHMNLSGYAAERAGESSRMVLRAGLRQVGLTAGRSLAGSISDLSSQAFFIYVSILGIKNPSLIPAAVAMIQLTNPVRRLFGAMGGIIASINANMGGTEKVVEALELPGEPERYARTPQCEREKAARREIPAPVLGPDDLTPLRVSGLSFKYRRSDRPALEGVSFVLESGQRKALVGPSGGGKSTLVKLILGLYPPASGEIVAFGNSIYDTPLTEWRRMFSYVPQNAFLFAGTVYENILGGLDDPGAEKVEEAARLANAHEFIAALPDGYRSLVGERGATLSGGQRQRIAIARAILRNSPILLLDEATSSLDTESEALVQDALDRLMANRTTLVVAHRLSTVREADEILVMDGGKVIERGRHAELLALGGTYHRLVEEGLGGKKAQSS
jgi:ATP-binding cassette subfamily B protein